MGPEVGTMADERHWKMWASPLRLFEVCLIPKKTPRRKACLNINQSTSYLLSLSLHQLDPSSPNYTSQVHAALSGKYLVPQLEDYLSVNSTARCLVITFDAATIPNANLEPIRELRRVLDGANPESVFKI